MKRVEAGTVVFTNYNGAKNGFLTLFLETLQESVDFAQSKGFLLDIVAVDDSSTDGSINELERVRLERNDQMSIVQTQNVDVTAAVNMGINYALKKRPHCQYIITTDVDTALSEDFIFELLWRAKQSDERTGMFASNQYLLSSYPKMKTHRSTGHFVGKSGATLDRDFLDSDKTRNKKILCPCISGALFKTNLLREIGLVHRNYLHYNNCTELGFRAQFANWSVEFVDLAIMWHNRKDNEK